MLMRCFCIPAQAESPLPTAFTPAFRGVASPNSSVSHHDLARISSLAKTCIGSDRVCQDPHHTRDSLRRPRQSLEPRYPHRSRRRLRIDEDGQSMSEQDTPLSALGEDALPLPRQRPAQRPTACDTARAKGRSLASRAKPRRQSQQASAEKLTISIKSRCRL